MFYIVSGLFSGLFAAYISSLLFERNWRYRIVAFLLGILIYVALVYFFPLP